MSDNKYKVKYFYNKNIKDEKNLNDLKNYNIILERKNGLFEYTKSYNNKKDNSNFDNIYKNIRYINDYKGYNISDYDDKIGDFCYIKNNKHIKKHKEHDKGPFQNTYLDIYDKLYKLGFDIIDDDDKHYYMCNNIYFVIYNSYNNLNIERLNSIPNNISYDKIKIIDLNNMPYKFYCAKVLYFFFINNNGLFEFDTYMSNDNINIQIL